MKRIIKIIPEVIKREFYKTNFFKNYLIKKSELIHVSQVESILNSAPPLFLDEKIKKKPYVAIIKSQETLFEDCYLNYRASWLRYERFCKTNNIQYEIFDIKDSNWLKDSEKFDLFVCHTESTPAFQEMIESKIYILDRVLGKFCFPSFHELWQYEDKIRSNYLYQVYDLPMIPTSVILSKEEALNKLNEIKYPFISKTTIGAGSSGVMKIDSKKQATRLINKIFGFYGLKSQYPYKRQKDYFYMQEFVEGANFDLRIMLVGNRAFGYYRYPNKGDFRASGSGNTEKKALPIEAVQLAMDVRHKLGSRQMGVDLLYSDKENRYLIIETSLFNQIDTAEQLVIDGIPGYYDISDVNNIHFVEGKFWVQELLLNDLIIEYNTRMDTN